MKNGKFELSKYLDWSIAICYHPMYMLVDEDRGEPVIGERIPPWGTPTVENYLERVIRNLASLEADETLTLNYEWAVAALEDIQKRFPEIFERMKKIFAKGQLDFVGGDYSLVHSNCQSSEACWRLIEYGQEEFERLFGKRLTTFAHQETHIHEQLPQILKMHGFKYMVAPSFPWTLRLTSGGLDVTFSERGAQITKGNDFVYVEALDGTKLPGFIPTNVRQSAWQEQVIIDLWAAPTLWIDFPDLEEYHNPQPLARPVILEKELDQRINKNPPKASGRMITKFSYAEGVWAEEHLRASRIAEEAAVIADAANALALIAGYNFGFEKEIREIFKEILKYEDHDVTWIEVTNLRRKAINRQYELRDKAKKYTRSILENMSSEVGGMSLVNLLPYRRKTVITIDNHGELPLGLTLQKVGDKVITVAEASNAGYSGYNFGGKVEKTVKGAVPQRIECKDYSVELNLNGLIRQIVLRDGRILLDESKGYAGGEVRAVAGLEWNDKEIFSGLNNDEATAGGFQTTNTSTSYKLNDGEWVDNTVAECSFEFGPVCDILTRSGTLGNIPFIERYLFFKDYPGIKVEIEYQFDRDTIGDMHLEETKLNVYYPTFGGDVYHDVPFGYVKASDYEQLYSTNYTYCGGIALINRGTVKGSVKNGVISNTLAWGSKYWSNRLHFDFWMEKCKTYDLRLDGKQKLEYWICPMGNFDAVKLAEATDNIKFPLIPVKGKLDIKFMDNVQKELRITSFYVKEGKCRVRGYKLPGGEATNMNDFEIFDRNISFQENPSSPSLLKNLYLE